MPKTSTVQAKKQSLTKRPFTRRNFLSTSLKAGAAAFTTGLLPKLKTKAQGQYNVLFIVADDLRPLLGCYGHPEIHTPNIDRIAERGTLFNRAYCQYPLCNPSRTSILTGLRPDTTHVLNNSKYFRDTVPSAVPLPQYFKEHGYHTRSIGKIVHGSIAQNDNLSWSTPIWRPRWISYQDTLSWQALDVPDNELSDGKIAKTTVKVLSQIKDQQFFLAIGFYKPHLPYHVPRKYYDLYDIKTFKKTPPIRPQHRNEIRVYEDIPNGNFPISTEKTLELIRGYAASMSYMDAQVGRVLNQLEALGLTENTVIAFCGDHGYHLGEHGTWSKNTTVFEVSLRSPMIISVPGQQSNQTDALTELVDIYPTLCGACQLPIPEQLEGISLTPVIEQPTLPWKAAAFSQLRQGGLKAYSMRTERYRYSEWGPNGTHSVELYDYQTGPDEIINIANFPENAKLVAQLSEQLHEGWKTALPNTTTQITTPEALPWDINNDGVIDSDDLVLVSRNFGRTNPRHPKVDVNKDGSVDLVDLIIVALHFGESTNPAAPSTYTQIPPQHLSLVEEWITEVRLADDGSHIFRQGIAALEGILNKTIPEKTVLLPNYPNPFNPETWIPYDLAQDAEVHINIYNLKGESIRRLSLGFQTAGTYRTPTRAAHWDGRNSIGELVASGVYFYSLQAGNVKATRQMVILK